MIPIKLLKIIGSSVSQFLALLVNQSFQSGIFPDKLKLAKVISLFKKGNPEIPSNYRPISLVPIFSKIFEKLMYRRLYRFLEIHEVLYSLQFGFQENHSIDHALVCLTEAVRNTLDNKRLGCGIFIDLQKAFDTVNHRLLLSELFVDTPLNGLDHIYLIESNMFLLMEVILTYFQLLVVCHKALYWAHYFSLSISMIYEMLLRS